MANLYASNGASPGSGVPGGFRNGNQLTRNTGQKPAGQQRRRQPTPPRPSSRLPNRRPPVSTTPQPPAQLNPLPVWDADAMYQAALNQLDAQNVLGKYNTDMNRLKANDYGLHKTHLADMYGREQQDIWGSNAHIGASGLSFGGAAKGANTQIANSYVPRKAEIDDTYGENAVKGLQSQKDEARRAFIMNLLAILQTKQSQNTPIPGAK